MIDEYWESSPFGKDSIFNPSFDEKQRDEKAKRFQAGEIIDISISSGDLIREEYFRNNKSDRLRKENFTQPIKNISQIQSNLSSVTVSISVYTKGYSEGVYVTVNNNKQRAIILGSKFIAVFKLSIPKKEGKKKFEITAQITDFNGDKSVDAKTMTATIDSDGKISEIVTESNNYSERKNIKELTPSLNLFSFLKEVESLHKIEYDEKNEIKKIVPYSSVEGGNKTIGWGHKIKTGENFDKGITLEEAEKLLVNDVQSAGVDKLLSFTGDKKINVLLNQNEYDAVISAVFGNGYGESLAKAINKGSDFYMQNPETIYNAFLTRRFVGKTANDGLIKRRAREADIFIKNKWHSYGPSDEKFKNGNDYIDAYKKFLNTGVLPLLIFISLIFTNCTTKKSEKKSLKSEVFIESKENTVKTGINKSDSLNAALMRIELVDDGEGSNFKVMENYAKEKDLWLKETALIRSKLGAKIEKECPELKQAFIDYNEELIKFMDIQRKFATKYMEHYYQSGVSVFPISSFYRKEYKQRLEQYYFLYEIDSEVFIDNN